MEYFSLARGSAFLALSAVLVVISRKPLRNPRCHGFYRYFAFEGILFLLLLNQPYWFAGWHSLHQVVSWLLLGSSILFVVQGLHMLRSAGGQQQRTETPENFAFENTLNLVTDGIFHYIRHPMYGSLLLLAWGAFFKHVSPAGSIAVVWASLFLIAAGLIEERENIRFFGAAYREYSKTTKMFLPFLF